MHLIYDDAFKAAKMRLSKLKVAEMISEKVARLSLMKKEKEALYTLKKEKTVSHMTDAGLKKNLV